MAGSDQEGKAKELDGLIFGVGRGVKFRMGTNDFNSGYISISGC